MIQSTEQPDQINRISMATTPSSSSQGKYKDIILEDELGDIELGKRRGRTPGEDYSPEEKRRRFLERNRYFIHTTTERKNLVLYYAKHNFLYTTDCI